MHDLFFENQQSLGEALFVKLAGALDLPSAQLKTAVVERKYQARVQGDFAAGIHNLAARSRSAFVITETELKLMAAAAIMGFSSRPNAGKSTPAASGTPTTL